MAFLSMGGSEDEVTEILRQQKRQEDRADATRGKSYLTDTGRGTGGVPNIAGAISDIFVRGNAEKKQKELGADAAMARQKGNETVRDYLNAAMGKGLGGVDLNKTASQAEIGFPSGDGMNMPKVAPLGGPPPAPPAPAAGPPPAAAPQPLPQPAPAKPPVVAPAAPPGNTGGASGSWGPPEKKGGYGAYGGIVDALASGGEGIQDLLAKLLRRG